MYITQLQISMEFAVVHKHTSYSVRMKGIRKVSQNLVPFQSDFKVLLVIAYVIWGFSFDKISVSLDCCITGL